MSFRDVRNGTETLTSTSDGHVNSIRNAIMSPKVSKVLMKAGCSETLLSGHCHITFDQNDDKISTDDTICRICVVYVMRSVMPIRDFGHVRIEYN